MIEQIAVEVHDGAGKPYMMRVPHTHRTPEATVAYINAEFQRMGFPVIQVALATEEQYAAYCRQNFAEKQTEQLRMEPM